MANLLLLIVGLILILLAAEWFTNGIEEIGRRLSLTQAVVGSILAAIGTALPETILPLVAILLGGKSAHEIGIGAILGAPFMLSTLAFFLVGITALFSFIGKKRRFDLNIEVNSIRRDLLFFIVLYSSAVLIPSIFRGKAITTAMATILIGGYLFYTYKTFKGESREIEHAEEVYLWKLLNKAGIVKSPSPSIIIVILQVLASLSTMIQGAHVFVKALEALSYRTGLDPLIFSLLLAPVATELPEKFNSITWTWKGRDTLAMGNITGAMVFQSTFPVSIGLLFTDWRLTNLAILSAILALLSSLIVIAEISIKKKVSPATVLAGGGFYLIYAIVVIMRHAL